MQYTSVDLFSGCGGLSLGLAQAGFQHLFAVEAHADAFETYARNLIAGREYGERWPEWLPIGPTDIRTLLSAHYQQLAALRGQVDLLAGGPPCQGFSMNGRRNPADPRSAMIDSYLEFVAAVRPKVILLENVRGFVSMPHPAGGYYPDYAKERLSELGYSSFDSVLAAADWGVPQRRPRYILIAFPKGSLPGVDPIERLKVKRRTFLEKLGLWPGPTRVRDALCDLETGNNARLKPDTEFGDSGFLELDYRQPADLSPYLNLLRQGSEGAPTDMRLARHSREVVNRMRDVLTTCTRGQSISATERRRLGIKKRSTTPLHPDAPSPTITTLPDDLIHYSEPRSLTVREHARIQSFPDWYSFSGPYTTGGSRRQSQCPRYTQVGNAVPPLLARAIGETLLSLLDDQNLMNLPNSSEIAKEVVAVNGEIVDRHVDIPAFV